MSFEFTIDVEGCRHRVSADSVAEAKMLASREHLLAHRAERLELLLSRLKQWQHSPSNVSWQPVQLLIKELSNEATDGTTRTNDG